MKEGPKMMVEARDASGTNIFLLLGQAQTLVHEAGHNIHRAWSRHVVLTGCLMSLESCNMTPHKLIQLLVIA